MITRDQIVATFRTAAVEITGRELPPFHDAAPFEELGMDSVDAVEILTCIEGKLGVEFHDDHLAQLRSIADVVRIVNELREASP